MWQSEGGKHGPNRLRNYIEIHETVIRRFMDLDFIEEDALTLTPNKGAIRMEGNLRCIGGLLIKVKKDLEVLSDEEDPLIRNAFYTYILHVQRLVTRQG